MGTYGSMGSTENAQAFTVKVFFFDFKKILLFIVFKLKIQLSHFLFLLFIFSIKHH